LIAGQKVRFLNGHLTQAV